MIWLATFMLTMAATLCVCCVVANSQEEVLKAIQTCENLELEEVPY